MEDMKVIDKEIFKASKAIDKALSTINNNNRGEVSLRILSVVRNLNDHIAYKIWADVNPGQETGVHNVAKKLGSRGQFKFIGLFHHFLSKSVSHFTPSEDGAERLMLKYYRYLLELKKIVYERYNMVILENISYFLEDLDEQTLDYYRKVSFAIENIKQNPSTERSDNYYIDKVKPFYINHDIYYEITLEAADERHNKFNAITAFSNFYIPNNYCVSLSFEDASIEIFDVDFPIKIISGWQPSIRPCEINRLSRVFDLNVTVNRSYAEYKEMMIYLKEDQVSLLEIIDFPPQDYLEVKERVASVTHKKHSEIFDILDKCRELNIKNKVGKNTIRYILHRFNNQFLKDQLARDAEDKLAGLGISKKCYPFEKKPFSFHPKGHFSRLYDLIECIDIEGHENELLARTIDINTTQYGQLFTPFDKLTSYGDKDEISKRTRRYNSSLYEGFKPNSKIEIYDNYVYKVGHEIMVLDILNKLKELSNGGNSISNNFTEEKVDVLKTLEGREKLDDEYKETILKNMFQNTQVHLIYGAAGTGKTTLINHVAKLLKGKRKAFIAKTNPAVENLRRKIVSQDVMDSFMTVDSFVKQKSPFSPTYQLIVVDECSTVKNEEILEIIKMCKDAAIILVGDTYQIQAIGYGSWFSLCRNFLPKHCCDELVISHRTTNKYLNELWKEVREMEGNNTALENMVRNDYSLPIGHDIFEKKEEDEIILCLNYNGLYGLNNINRLLQLSNPNKAVDIGVLRFKQGDPILFNDSERFDLLYNNLKGKILDFTDDGDSVLFEIEVAICLSSREVSWCSGLSYIRGDGETTVISFKVNRRAPYSSDEESNDKGHIIPFQVAYAVSIHKSQGLEYDSVKIVIADESEERISHNIFYTAITRARKQLTIYWSPEVSDRILKRIKPNNYTLDFNILKNKNPLNI